MCRDHDEGIEYQFFYDEHGKLDRLRLVNLRHIDPQAGAGMWGNPLPAGSTEDRARLKAARLDSFYEAMARNNRKSPRSLFDDGYAPREFLCCTDQMGTLRAITAPNGAIVKEIRRDSFGVPYHDSFPNLHLPIGFAGGLTDPDTGLVRFGWRDSPLPARLRSHDRALRLARPGQRPSRRRRPLRLLPYSSPLSRPRPRMFLPGILPGVC